ncbi:hypothetical protein E2C01_006905 [Portunus trituberculatus]|uniref:Uncharacterized protein n=1 Tax=Portunus trituberculatus TaxID=210409 RepID=A0A5B7CWD0_PORTR|nr:hypothetical protein [Portunus trituberculatus]
MIFLECPLVQLFSSSISDTRSCQSIFSIWFTNLYNVLPFPSLFLHTEYPLFPRSSL